MDINGNLPERGLTAESDHRIANHLTMLASYIRLKTGELRDLADPPDRAGTLMALEGIRAQIAAVSELHRLLSTTDPRIPGDIGAQLGRICEAFRAGPASGVPISFAADPGCILPFRQILPVSQIVSEVMTNALKHGHKAGHPGGIRASCRRDGALGIVIRVEDDGQGLGPPSPGGAVPPGLGARLVEALARQVGGTIRYRSCDTGLSFSLRLRLADRAAIERAPGYIWDRVNA